MPVMPQPFRTMWLSPETLLHSREAAPPVPSRILIRKGIQEMQGPFDAAAPMAQDICTNMYPPLNWSSDS